MPINIEFPIRSPLGKEESGQGYALRMASANMLNGLSAIKKMLGKSRFVVLSQEDAPRLSRWFGADQEELGIALGATHIGHEAESYLFGGIELSKSYFINRSQPRVCSACLEEGKPCSLAWEISLMTSCPIHKISLLDICPDCHKKIRWDRPHIDMCRCGWSLITTAHTSTQEENEVSEWIEFCLFRKILPRPHTTSIGTTLSHMDLNTGLILIYSLCSTHIFTTDGARTLNLSLRKNHLSNVKSLIQKSSILLNASDIDIRLHRVFHSNV